MNTIPQFADKLSDGHPVKVYFEENVLTYSLLQQLVNIDISQDFETFFNIFNQLSAIEKRFTRKENQLFPYLEKHGWTSPSQGMWAFHDKIRDNFRALRKCLESKEFSTVDTLVSSKVWEVQFP